MFNQTIGGDEPRKLRRINAMEKEMQENCRSDHRCRGSSKGQGVLGAGANQKNTMKDGKWFLASRKGRQ